MTPPSAAANLWRLTERRLLIFGVVFVAVTVIVGALVSVSHNYVLATQTEIQQRLTTNLSASGLQAVQAIVKQHPAAADALKIVFPNIVSFPDFVVVIEALIHTYDKEGGIQFPSKTPVKTAGELTIPARIHFRTSLPEVNTFLKEMEQLPYIIEVTALEIQSPDGQDQPVTCNLGVKLYVQDPFAKP
jgi:hypothetical protein